MLQQLFGGRPLRGGERRTGEGEEEEGGGRKGEGLLTKLGSLLRQASTNSLSGLL